MVWVLRNSGIDPSLLKKILFSDLARQHQLQLLQRQQFSRQQQLLGKGQPQFRPQTPQQSPSRSPMQFGQTSPMPQHFVTNPTSPMPPQSPQFPGSSPIHPQSPMLNQHPNSSPILPQSPMQNQQFQNVTSPHPQSPMVQQYVNQPPNSPIHPLSPRVQQNFQNQPQSPITTPHSPMISQNYHQTPNSPMTHHFNQPSSPRPPQSSPMGAPQSPLLQQGQMSQSQFVHRPNSPIRSPMPPVSPMPMRRPSSTGASPQFEGINFENPSPRMMHDQDMNVGGGGGNPHMNLIPAPPELGRIRYFKLGLRGGAPMWGSDQPPLKRTISTNSIKPGEFEEDLSRSSPSTSKSPQKKNQSIESQDGAVKNDDESTTVYEDIVLVDNETNLEVEELQSSLQGNVMTMPMVIDGGQLQMSEMNIESENVENLEDCLVSSSNLVGLGVEPSGSEETDTCLLEMVDKDESGSVQEDLMMLDEDLAERESKEDESDEMMEESMSPPISRKRLVGKVLPGESLKKLQEKRDSTTDTPDSPDQEEGTNEPSPEAYASETDNDIVSTTFDTKSESLQQDQNIVEDKDKPETKQIFPMVLASSCQTPPSSAHQANISVSKPALGYNNYPRGVPRHVFPLIRTDGRSVIAVQQAAVANLVQDAVNAAKLAAEKKQYPQAVSVGSSLIPTLMSTPSTIASIGVVSTTGTTLIAPPRMSLPFSTSSRITANSTVSNSQFMPVLSQAGGLLKIEMINQKAEVTESEKAAQVQTPVASRQTLVSEIPEGFQKHFVDSITQNMAKPDENKGRSDMPVGPHPSKAHSYSKILMTSSEMQTTKPADEFRDINQGMTMQNFGHTGVICNKMSVSGNQQSSVITQVSVINEGRTLQNEGPPTSIGSSILEAQLTASNRDDNTAPRNPAVSSPSKTLFSFLDHMREINKHHQREPQSGSLNLQDMSVTYDDNKVHTEGLTLYRSSESVMTQSTISQMLKSTGLPEVKIPVSVVTQLPERIDESRGASQSVRRIGNIYVHPQNVKEENESLDRSGSMVFSNEQLQGQKMETSPVIKTEIRAASTISELFRQKQPLFDQKSTIQQREAEGVNYSSSSTMTMNIPKTAPTRLGELISGGTNVHAHIERRITIAGQADLDLAKSQYQTQQMIDNHNTSNSEANQVFANQLQRESVKDNPSQFIPLSSILTPKPDPDDKRYSLQSRGNDDSQNVLLKQLLQNTACATTSSNAVNTAVNTAAPVPPVEPEPSPVSLQPPQPSLPPPQPTMAIRTQQVSFQSTSSLT